MACLLKEVLFNFEQRRGRVKKKKKVNKSVADALRISFSQFFDITVKRKKKPIYYIPKK